MRTDVPAMSDVQAAAKRIHPYVHRTPVLTSQMIDNRTGARIFMKAENLQKVGAFKARGAVNAILQLDQEEVERGIATQSSGNHGQAVAYASAIVGARATIVVPDHAPPVKVAAMEGYGAHIMFCAQDERDAALAELVASTGATVVHPFDHPHIIAGQGTAALELVEDVRDLDVIITPIGGGGLLSGTSIVAEATGCTAIGAEPEIVDDAYRSLESGVRYPATGQVSVGDGLLTGIGQLPFDILRATDTKILTVSEDDIMEAVRYVLTRTKHLVEPSAATAFAMLFNNRERFAGRRVGLIVSGGNIELSKISG